MFHNKYVIIHENNNCNAPDNEFIILFDGTVNFKMEWLNCVSMFTCWLLLCNIAFKIVFSLRICKCLLPILASITFQYTYYHLRGGSHICIKLLE